MIWIDYILLAFMAMGLIRGMRNGFFIELAGLISLLFGVYLAIQFSYIANHILARAVSWNPKIIQIIAFVITLILVLVGAALLAKLFTTIARVAQLGAINKIGGGILGTVKLIVVLSLGLSLFAKLNFSNAFLSKETIDKSYLYTPVEAVSKTIYPKLQEVFIAFGPQQSPDSH
ncbi:MAG: CvpA family protein [Flavobacterium sp.]|nr:CvpA family protein [Flavobacterium sp.]